MSNKNFQIANYQKASMIDMPGCVSCVIFTQGCNCNCEYCHNKESIPMTPGAVTREEVEAFLVKRANILDAVVFSGGEPTLQEGLFDMLFYCKILNYKVGLHTNGLGPHYKSVAGWCDYILLSHYTEKSIEIGMDAKALSLSTVVKNETKKGGWENVIKKIK